MARSIIITIIFIAFVAGSLSKCEESTQNVKSSFKNLSETENLTSKAIVSNVSIPLSGRADHKSFIKDIVERLHRLDDDIGRLVVNSTSAMYSPTAEELTYEDSSKSGEKFSEVLADLDALQDEVGSLVKNATNTRQYNILVRLRPLSTLLYRIRHNMHLIRNSLVAINTGKFTNSSLDK